MERGAVTGLLVAMACVTLSASARAEEGDSRFTSASLEFIRVHAVGEFSRGHVHTAVGVVDVASRVQIPGPFPLHLRFRLADLSHDDHQEQTSGEAFARFSDRWATAEARLELGRLGLGAGFVLVERVDWMVPARVSRKLWARAGMTSTPFPTLEGDTVRIGLPRVLASLELGPLELGARWEALGWSPLGWSARGRARLAWRGVSLNLSGGYTHQGGTFTQYGGAAGAPEHAGGITWTMRAADLSVVLGVDFWAPYRHLTPRFPGYVQLQVGTRVRHVAEHTLSDSRGVFFTEEPGAQWGLWAGLAVGVLYNQDWL